MGFILDIFKPKVAKPAVALPKTEGTRVTDTKVNEAARRDRARIQALRGNQQKQGLGGVTGLPNTAKTELLGA
jgi:hypothetical protein